ncbi:MAG: YgeY family selenium metabolism-linked hydrolase [Anaerolineae bacterium]
MKFELSPQDRSALTAFLQDLVRTPGLSTKEDAVAARLAEEMRRVGFTEVYEDRIGNVIGRIGSGQGPKLLYNGHMDTVGVGDLSTWPRDPFGAEIEDGILYGRGASDMKGALAAMVYGAKLLIDSSAKLKGDLYVAGVVQEEISEGLAMRVLVEEEGLRPDYVILGEATDLQISRGQRGRMEMKVVVRGRSCHASAPHRGVNAIYGAARLISGLESLAPHLKEDPFLGKGTLAVTYIENTAGSRNVVPDSCTFYIDRRLTLGETEESALAEVRDIIRAEKVEASVALSEELLTSRTGYCCRHKEYYPPWTLPEEHPFVQTLAQVIHEALGYRPKIGCWAFSTDGVYTMGVAGIPTVGFGPGQEGHTHTIHDQVHLEDVFSAARVYASLAAEVLR